MSNPPENLGSAEPHHAKWDHERPDVSARRIVVSAVMLIISAVLVHVGVWWMLQGFQRSQASQQKSSPTRQVRDSSRPFEERLQDIPAPRLEALEQLQSQAAGQTMQERKSENAPRLESYGWVDKEKGIVHIPISRAMRLVVERESRLNSGRPGEQR